MKAIFLIEYEKGESLNALVEKLRDKTKFFAKPFSHSLHCRPLKKRYNNSYSYQGKIYFMIKANLFFFGNQLYIDFSSYNTYKIPGRIVISDEELNHCVLRALAGLEYSTFIVRQIIYADIANNTIRDLTDKVKIVGVSTKKNIIKTEGLPLKQGVFLTYILVAGKYLYVSSSTELEPFPGTPGTHSRFQTDESFSREVIRLLIYPEITIAEINGLFYPTYKGYQELLVPFLRFYTKVMKIPNITGLRYEYIPYSFHNIGKKEGIVEQNYRIKILKPCESYEEANEAAETIKAKIALSLLM